MSKIQILKTERVVYILLSIIMLYSCSGIKFHDAQNVFKPPSPYLSQRTLWHNPSIIQYKLQSLTGYIIQKSAGADRFTRIRQILPDDYEIEPEPITNGQFYHSLINGKFVSEGTGNIPLLSVAASLGIDQMMEITIVDKAIIHVEDSVIPWTRLETFIDNNPLSPGAERFWVQAVLLTQVFSKTATKVESNAEVSGAAFQVKGEVYNAAETQDRASYITMLTLDIDLAIGGDDRRLFNPQAAIKRGRIARTINDALE